MITKLRDHHRKPVLGRLDKDIELQKDKESKKRYGKKRVFLEKAKMEGEVVEKAIRVGQIGFGAQGGTCTGVK